MKLLHRIKSWFKSKPEPDYRLIECYNKDGVKLYKFDNPLRLPTHRRMALFTALNDAEIGVTKEQIQTFCSMVQEYGTAGRVGDIMAAASILEAYSSQDYTSSLLFHMTAPVILLEGEDAEKNDVEFSKKKKDLFEHNADVKAFFLSMGFVYLKSFSNSSIGHINIEDFLQNRQLQRIEKMFLRQISMHTKSVLLKNSTSKSTPLASEQEKQTKN